MSMPKTQSVLSILESAEVPLAERQNLLSVAFARAMAYQLPIPGAAVEDAYDYFRSSYESKVNQHCCEINEQCVLDIDSTISLTQRIWLFRYRMVYDAGNVAVRQFLDAMIRVGTREVPPQVSELLVNEKPELLDALAARLQDCLSAPKE